MFERLARELESLVVPVDARALTELIALRDRVDAIVTAAVGEFDAAELWDAEAATSMQAWLRDRARMTGGLAARLVTNARRTRALPVTREAWASGAVSSGQVEVILANVRKDTGLFAEHEAALVPRLAPLSIFNTVEAMQEWRRRVDALADVPEGEEPASRVFLSEMLDGRGALDGDLDADDHAIVATALRVATGDDVAATSAWPPECSPPPCGSPSSPATAIAGSPATLEVTDPSGTVRTSHPPGTLQPFF